MMKEIKRGFISKLQPARWEEAMLCGNGSIGALVMGNTGREEIIFCHERLFAPLYPKIEPVDTASRLHEIREMLNNGEYQRSADYVVELSHQQGYGEKRWTDPFFPACSMFIGMPEI